MARKPDNRLNAPVSSGVSPSKNDAFRKAALIKVDNNGNIAKTDNTGDTRALFLLNPASYEESKSSNWVAHQVPGQSDPVYQWVSGGARQITFEALVTRDSSASSQLNPSSKNPLEGIVDTALNVVGDIASNFAGIALPPIGDLFTDKSPTSGIQLSITGYLNYYRSLLYPTYTADKKSLASSPPLVVFVSGNTFHNVPHDTTIGAAKQTAYLPVWMVTDLNIRITKQLPNLEPMEAWVNFTLKEYPIAPIEASNFISSPPTAPSADEGGIIGFIGGLF